GGGGASKPALLSSNATYQQAIDKLDEIIEYCEDHPGTANDGVKSSARTMRDNLSDSNWDIQGSARVSLINTTLIAILQ
ncbi:MAG: hypothetical protein LBL28_05350, partial [Treponema sp.]|nr:hypothetical protein [Treponema sp.]